jgi:DNA-binding transcriptional ArsR family regulator
LVSKHLGVLRDVGSVDVTVVGKRRVYRLAENPLPAVLAWVTPYHRKWSSSLDRLSELVTAASRDEDEEEQS